MTTAIKKQLSVSSRFMDFWLLGGASLVLFIFMMIANIFRSDSVLIQQKFMMFGGLFAISTAICNHPHFIITYRFGYMRGWNFILKYWFSLLAVPIGLFALYLFAYVFFDKDISDFYLTTKLNDGFSALGLNFRFGEIQSLGPTLVGLSIWIMYCTVGWHYSKQVYGCMMVYNHYDKYGLTKFQKLWIRYSLLILSVYQFVYLSAQMDRSSSYGYQDPRFSGIKMSTLGLPDWILSLSQFLMIVGLLGTILIFVSIYLKNKKIPSPVFLVSWIALYVWWIQIINIPEFYFMAVPFFHSLQYLPFAAKMEKKKIPINSRYYINITARILLLLVVGLMIFEFIPTYFDQKLETQLFKSTWFFVTAVSVFINIHHFFIDSTVWRLGQDEVKAGILV